jgi:hypothetical protein
MHQIANRLGINVPNECWPELVEAATFDRMRERSSQLIPGAHGVLKDPAAFFHRGSSGAGREALNAHEIAEYEHRAAALARQDLISWLHRP